MSDENWIVEQYPYTEEWTGHGFLQLCADRRFHKLIQQEFMDDAGLSSPEDYWIHADAGGTPKMADQKITPQYCYGPKEVRIMGWSAHGDVCGGYGDKVPDDVIKQDLCKTMQKNVKEYPLATHYIYFVTIQNGETVIYRMIAKPGEDVFCTQGPE
jgi:hypothetical protein